VVDDPEGHSGSVGWFRQNWLDGADGVVVGPPGPEGLDVPVPVGWDVLVSVGCVGTHWFEPWSNCIPCGHCGGCCVVVVGFVGVGVGVGLGVGTYTDWQFASEPVGVPGSEPDARVPGSTDWPKVTMLLTPEHVGA